ncbi:hypothetical protein [uncultured Megasphaera sp.]|uniref:hypothetical protein n=1 Tax=uncultured Megasphaera sp. TaxID=165188 RepID=UPI002659BF34|nr:hypothetical protein [uncultured Megasphaera sp.]
MKLKYIALVGVIAISAAAVVPAGSSPSFAAKGGIKMSAPKALPAPKAVPSSSGNAAKSSTSTKQTAPGSQTKQQTASGQSQAGTAPSSSRWGGVMRNIGLLAGGMFLGSMLSSLFGWGGMGFMADIMGLLFNIILAFIVFALLSWAWRKIRGRRHTDDDDAYRRGYEAAKREERFRHHGPTIDVTPVDDEEKKKKW